MASITPDGFKYDVFLSFRGEDTRHGFTGFLWKALNEGEFHTFFDEKDIKKGEEITPALVKAIDESRMAIIVLSENYASSSFCLQELSHILECIKEKGRCVLPVFYDVDPINVRYLTGTYGEAIANHKTEHKAMYKNKFNDAMSKLTDIFGISYKNENRERLKKWNNSLQQVANLASLSYSKKREGYEYELIEEIIQKVSSKIKSGPNYPVKTCEKPKEASVSLIGIIFRGIIWPGMWSLYFVKHVIG